MKIGIELSTGLGSAQYIVYEMNGHGRHCYCSLFRDRLGRWFWRAYYPDYQNMSSTGERADYVEAILEGEELAKDLPVGLPSMGRARL